jgi:transposase
VSALNAKRFKSSASEQGELLPTYPSDLVAEDHLARIISDVVESMDLSSLYAKYGWEGGEAFHPKAMLRVMFYGYSQGLRSSRRISQACRENFVFMYLSGGQRPDFRTISLFRQNHLDLLKELFKQIVHICYHLGMISLGQICLDGTKVKANASDKTVAKKDKLQKELARIEEEISQIFSEAATVDSQEDIEFGKDSCEHEIPKELLQKKTRQKEIKELLAFLEEKDLEKISLTDEDSRFMRNHGRIELCYNGQCATENQVILTYDLTDNASDKGELIPMVKELEELSVELFGKEEYPLEDSKVLTDAGYNSGENLSYLEDR